MAASKQQSSSGPLPGGSAHHSGEEALDHLTPIQTDRTALPIAHLARGIDAQDLVDRGADVVRRIWRRGGVSRDPVGLADHLAAADAGASEEARETRSPMIPARAPRPALGGDLGRPAKLAQHQYQGLFEQPGR